MKYVVSTSKKRQHFYLLELSSLKEFQCDYERISMNVQYHHVEGFKMSNEFGSFNIICEIELSDCPPTMTEVMEKLPELFL